MLKTKLLYLTDSYLREFPARVLDLSDHSVVLDQTSFYPRGGGQMSDRGRLMDDSRTYEVVAVEKRGDAVFHTLDGGAPKVGSEIKGALDWDFRYQMMRTHSALHVLCAVVYQHYGAHVTGCQMHLDRARMDFTLVDLDPVRVREIERLANEVVSAGHPVRTQFIARREADLIPDLIRTKINLVPVEIDPVRVVEIIGVDLQADGGTHVANTLEIGGIRIMKVENKGRENRRLEIELVPPAAD